MRTSHSEYGFSVKAFFGSTIWSGSSSTTTLPAYETLRCSNGVDDLELDPAGIERVVVRDLRPLEHERHPPVRQVDAHGHLGVALVGPVAASEPPADPLGRVVDVEVHALVEVGLGAQLVHVLVDRLEAQSHAAGPYLTARSSAAAARGGARRSRRAVSPRSARSWRAARRPVGRRAGAPADRAVPAGPPPPASRPSRRRRRPRAPARRTGGRAAPRRRRTPRAAGRRPGASPASRCRSCRCRGRARRATGRDRG